MRRKLVAPLRMGERRYRTRNRFLLIPKTIDNEWRWLEWATWEEMQWRGQVSGRTWCDPVRWLDPENDNALDDT